MVNKKPHIALLMMMKNEKKRLHVSLESVKDYVDSFVVYDTGSTDNTLEILKDFTDKHKIPLRLKQGEFVNFAVSRNVSLDFADSFEDIDFLLLLDVNDELRGGEYLRKFAEEHMNTEYNAFLMCQEWWSGKNDKYFNTRFIRAHKGWRYKGSVHEWMYDSFELKDGPPVMKMPPNIVLYQDRTQDDDKSSKRFHRDKELLLADYKKDPTEPRTLFYLAQTCGCLGQYEEALYYNKLRADVDGFVEEKFHAILRAGEMSQALNQPWDVTMAYYMKAVELIPRAEPLIKIAQHYNKEKKWLLAFTFANMACCLPYPNEAILFIDNQCYMYFRWHVLSIVAFYCDRHREGKLACLKALEAKPDSEADKKNLDWYEKTENEAKSKNITLTKSQFIHNVIEEMKKGGSKMSLQKMTKVANQKWKNRTK